MVNDNANYRGRGRIELWGGINTLVFLVIARAREYAGAGQNLWRDVSGGRAFAMSFWTCGYRNSSRVEPLQ